MAKASFTEPVRDSVAKISDEVAVGEDLPFQRSWWRFERGVWIFFVFVIALDLAGVFGRGPVAKAELRSPDGVVDVHYERIERTGTPSMMTIALDVGDNSVAELFVSDSIVSHLGAQRIIPQPTTTVLGRGGLTYTFPMSTPPAVVRFELQPAGPGIYGFEIAVRGAAPLRGTIVVMP